MPNATSVWDFSDGQILSASKLDDVNCGIHVFADATARTNAYGGTGERTLVEGEFSYLSDSNTTAYYDGSSWQTLAGGLSFITSSSFTNAATVTIDNCFTTTYKRYIATTQIIAGVGGSTQALQLQFRYGSTTQAASYYSAANIASYTGSSGVTSISNGSVIRIQSNMGYTQQRFEFGFVGNASERAIINWQSWGGDQGESFQGGGYVSSAQTYTGFILSNSLGSANMTGTVWVYGLAAS